MNELKQIKHMCDEVAPPRLETLVDGRARLMNEISEPGKESRRPSGFTILHRPAFRVAAVGGLAVAMAAGIMVAQDVGDGSPGKPGKSPGGILPAGPVANADDLVRRARAASQDKPRAPLGPDQWVYLKTRLSETDGSTGPIGRKTKFSTGEEWQTIRRIGPAARYMANFPEDPGAAHNRLLAEAKRVKKNDPEEYSESSLDSIVFRLAADMLPMVSHESRTPATLYAVITRLRGIKMLRNVADAAGRRGVALSIKGTDPYLRDEIIVDPETFRFLGERVVIPATKTAPASDQPGDPGAAKPIVYRKGVNFLSALLRSSVVSGSGKRP